MKIITSTQIQAPPPAAKSQISGSTGIAPVSTDPLTAQVRRKAECPVVLVSRHAQVHASRSERLAAGGLASQA